MILITGATGNLGKAAINKLLKLVAPKDLAVLVRDETKATALKNQGINIRIGSYDNYDSLVTAFKGIDKLYFISGSDIMKRSKQHENIVKAATEAGVSHVVYTSFQRKNETDTSPIALVAQSHLLAEKELKASGMKYTILKHGLYSEMLPIFLGNKLLDTKVIYQPAGEGKTAYTLREDMAEVAATILTSTGHENKTYDIVGDKAYSYAEIATIISNITGESITYLSPTQEEFSETLTGAGVPGEYIGLFSSFSEAIKQGEFESTSSDIETLLGRKATPVTDYLKLVFSLNN